MIYDLVMYITSVFVLWTIMDWIDFLVKSMVVSSTVTWLLFFGGMIVRYKFWREKIEFNQLNMIGKAIVFVFVLCDWLTNVQLTIFCWDLMASKTELVTGRMARYRELCLEGFSTGTKQLPIFASVPWYTDLSNLNKIRYLLGSWFCKQAHRVDFGHCGK